jgi:hypothetical protein
MEHFFTIFFFNKFSHHIDQKQIKCEMCKRFFWKNIVKKSQYFEEKSLKLPNGVL